jgi:hypothetical protein
VSEHTVERLFDAFAQAYQRGERPDVSEYLDRAGSERDDLGYLIDRFLQAVPAQPPTEEEFVLMQARLEHEPVLLILRKRRKLTREAVVGALVSALGLDPEKREKVAGYYHELEVGTLDPTPVSSRVWDALGDLLHANVRLIAGLRPPPTAPEAVFHRYAPYVAPAEPIVELLSMDAGEPKPPTAATDRLRLPERDEIDRLFTGGG